MVNGIDSKLIYTFSDGDMDSKSLINSGFYIVDHKMEQAHGASQWEVKDGKLTQSSSVYNPTYQKTDGDDAHENSFTYGTKILFGDTRWVDYSINVDVTPRSSSGSISILFKYHDDKNFYRYVMEYGKYKSYVLKYTDGKQTKIGHSKARYTKYAACTTRCTTNEVTDDSPIVLHTDDCAERCLSRDDCKYFARGRHQQMSLV